MHSAPAVMFLLSHSALAQPRFVLALRSAALYAKQIVLLNASGFFPCALISLVAP